MRARPFRAVSHDAKHCEMHESCGPRGRAHKCAGEANEDAESRTSGAGRVRNGELPAPAGPFARVGFARGRQCAREGGGGVD